MAKYFDAFLNMANWGTHRLILRLPGWLLPLESVRRYCTGETLSARASGNHVILDFRSNKEGGDGDWIEDDNDTRTLLVPIRSELAAGDLWELSVRTGGQIESRERIARLQQEHASKPSLMKRFREAGLQS